jgi:hypothetical protein
MEGLSALRNGPGLYIVSVIFSYNTSYANYYKKRKKKSDNTDEVFEGKKKVKQSRYRPGVAQRVPGS